MKLIISSIELQKEFTRLSNQYGKYYWNTAWAGIESKNFKTLVLNRNKIEKIIVGIHFYQTHPDFILEFLNDKNVKYIMQPKGTFHPKLYLFFNSKDSWELIIGSSNFTKAGFENNTEANILITSEDENATDTLKSAFKLINQSWQESTRFNSEELAKYKILWKNLKPKIKSLSGFNENDSKEIKPIHQVAIVSLTWEEYYKKVSNEDFFESRLKALKIIRNLFNLVSHFKDIDEEDRKLIAGIPNKSIVGKNIDWGIFGSMKGAGVFKKKIINNDENISKALDQIPITGQITRFHYDNYIKYFTKAFSGNYIATSTRLLAMKRPDVFYCLTSKNQKDFCKDFGIPYSSINYNTYWENIIEVIRISEWYLNPKFTTQKGERVSNARVAFLDALYYEE